MNRRRTFCPYFGNNYLKFACFFIINLNQFINMSSLPTSLYIDENRHNIGKNEFVINYDNIVYYNRRINYHKINDIFKRPKRNSMKSEQSSISKLVEVGMVRENNNYESTFLNTCPEKCSCLGDYYECKNLNLKELPSFPIWIRELDLSGNKLEDSIEISNNNLNQLIVLSLKRNRLSKIPVFKELFSLEELILSNNKIKAITAEAVLALPNLRVLDLSKNEISIILPNSFPVKNQLEQLNLNGNKIVSLGENSFNTLTYLSELQLNRNGLKILPTEIFKNLRNLKKLYLNDNNVNITYSMFKGLDKLKIIKLKSNYLSQLSDGVFYNLKFIESIDLDSNYIQELGRQSFYNLSTLTSLNLSNNSITTINTDTFEFTQDIVFLDLSKNQLTEIKSHQLNCLKKLQQLNLSYNKLRFINELAFQCISNLEILDLSLNNLSSVIEDKNGIFKHLKNLKVLNLNFNNIKIINQKTFIGLQNLQELNLNGNNITAIQYDSFDALQNLNILQINSDQFLCDCNIQYIYKWSKNNINKLLQNKSKIEIKCQYPSYLKGKTLFNLKTNQFICNESTKPRIIKEPSTQVVGKGKNVTFECAATSILSEKNYMEILWRKDNLDLQLNQTEIQTKIVFEKNMTIITSYLRLTNASHTKHSGRYQCIAKNNYGTIFSQKFKITVSSFPSFVKVPYNITIMSGDTARLECKALGDPKPQISWQKDGGNKFPAARERRMHIIQAEDTFLIVNAKVLDMGVYTCTANNPAGIISANATLIVNEAPLLLQDASIFKEVILGHSFVVECLCTGTPKPKLFWFKDNKLIESTDRHFYSASKQLLIITSSKSNDTGIYKCEIRNELGVKYGYNNIIIKKSNSNNVINIEEMIGIIIITVFCCAIATSTIWVVIIYQTKKPSHLNSIVINENSTPSNNHLQSIHNSNYNNNSNTSNHNNNYSNTNNHNNNYSNTNSHNYNASDSIISININQERNSEISLFPQNPNVEQSNISNHVEDTSRLSDASHFCDHSPVYNQPPINPFIQQQPESEFCLQSSPKYSKTDNEMSFNIVGIPLNDTKKNLYLDFDSIPLSGLDIDSFFYRKNKFKNNSKHLRNSLLKNPRQFNLSKSHETIFNCNNSLQNLNEIAFNIVQKKADSMSKDSGTGTYETINSYGKTKSDCASKKTNNLNNSLNSNISELCKSDSLEMELNSSTTLSNSNTRRKNMDPLNKIIYNESLTNQFNDHNNLSITNFRTYQNNFINDDLIENLNYVNYIENNSENFINSNNNNYNSNKNINSCDKKIKPPPLPVEKHKSKNRNVNQKEKCHVLLHNKKVKNDININDITEISSYNNKNIIVEVPSYSEKNPFKLIDTVHENTKDNDIHNSMNRFNRLKKRKSKINSKNNGNKKKDSIVNHRNINSNSIQSLELIYGTSSLKLNNNKSSNNSNDIVCNYNFDYHDNEYDISCHNIPNLDIHDGCIKNEDDYDIDTDGSSNMKDKSLLYFPKNNDNINLVNTSLVPLIQTNNKNRIRKNKDNHKSSISSNRNSSNNSKNKLKNITKNTILYNTVTIPVLATSSAFLLSCTSPQLPTSVSISSLPVLEIETNSK